MDGADRLTDGARDGARHPAISPGENGLVCLGEFESTAYGPPWDALNGMGITKCGTDIRDCHPEWIVAVDPTVVPLGTELRIWPNPFDHEGWFLADDIGGAIKGARMEFYDWRGREHQYGWGRRPVTMWKRASE